VTNPAVQKLLDKLATPEVSPVELAEAIYDARYTGPITTHYRNGVPQQVDLGPPVRVTICAGMRKDSGGT
jgi:hypothetical protein